MGLGKGLARFFGFPKYLSGHKCDTSRWRIAPLLLLDSFWRSHLTAVTAGSGIGWTLGLEDTSTGMYRIVQVYLMHLDWICIEQAFRA